jgi:anti-anti-sigma regulatory factor
MSIEYKRGTAHLQGSVTVEEAEALFEWLQARKKPKIDLSDCAYMHCANLLVLLALRPTIAAMPRDAELAAWLTPSLVAN